MVYLINETFVGLWVGAEYFAGSLFTLAVCGMAVRDAIMRATGVVLFAANDVRALGLFSVIEAVLTIGLSYQLAKVYGMGGAASGPLLATLLVVSPYCLVRVARITQLPIRTLLWRGPGRVLLRTVPAGLVLWAFAACLPKEWGWAWIGAVLAIAVVVNIAVFDAGVLWRTRHAGWSDRLRLVLQAR